MGTESALTDRVSLAFEVEISLKIGEYVSRDRKFSEGEQSAYDNGKETCTIKEMKLYRYRWNE